MQQESGRSLRGHFLILCFVSTDTYSASWLEIREHSAQTPQVLLTSQDKQALCHQGSTGRAGPESSAWSSQPPACEEAASVPDVRGEPASPF